MKGSLRSRVLKYLKENPETELKELKVIFGEYVPKTITRYFRAYTKSLKPFDVKSELIKIIKDYKSPASSRVQAIRELNNMRKDQPEIISVNEDPYVKFQREQNKMLEALEKEDLKDDNNE